ncbi:MAG: hypothetical protein IKR11_06495 [Solobacterium sp.]|nr:hypothetical protein [Solobacterium sp.]
MQWKEYPYEKNILLNTVYDVLEHLNYPMKNADSKAGKLQFLCGDKLIDMELSSISRNGETATCVGVFNCDQKISEVLLDEISGLLIHDYKRI